MMVWFKSDQPVAVNEIYINKEVVILGKETDDLFRLGRRGEDSCSLGGDVAMCLLT